MKSTLLVLASLSILGLFWWLWPAPARPGPVAEGAAVAAPDPRLERLERELADLRTEVERLSLGLTQGSNRPFGGRVESQPLPVGLPGATASAVGPREASSEAERDALWYLEQYVASFQVHSRGSERWRLAVQDYVGELVSPIAQLCLAAGTHPTLRQSLVEMLGTEVLAGEARAVNVLLDVLDRFQDEALQNAAVNSLEVIGGEGLVGLLEARVFGFPALQLQLRVVRLIAVLAGRDCNPALARLLRRAPQGAVQSTLFELLDSGDPAGALAAFEQAPALEQPVRLTAAQRIGAFGDAAVLAFIDHWLGIERDEQVREALGAARTGPGYGLRRVTGPNDVNDPAVDDANAWAASLADMGTQWLELSYSPPRRCSGLRIFEVRAAGFVRSVVAIDEDGGEHTVWAGTDPTTAPGVFELPIATTSYRVARVRLTIDTEHSPGYWEEIDTVELLGPDGRAWPVGATASSCYAD